MKSNSESCAVGVVADSVMRVKVWGSEYIDILLNRLMHGNGLYMSMALRWHMGCIVHVFARCLRRRVSIRVHRIGPYLRKWRTQPLWWVQNWNLRHLQNPFFDFSSRLASKFSKVLIWPKKFFWGLNLNRCKKTQNFTMILNTLKKLLAKQVWRTWGKVKKCIFSSCFC